jgi:hypothetical protein
MVKASKQKLSGILFLMGMFATLSVSAQSWMPGFNYRKSISINKAQVSGAVGLIDFPVLVSLTDPDLRFLIAQCNANKIVSAGGLDISFGSASAPGSPLKFQLDTYDPATGTLNCWVDIPLLSASGGTASNTIIYLYYGSNTFQDPFGTNALATWVSLRKLWHMNLDAAPATSMNAKFNSTSEMAKGTGVMNSLNFSTGKIGTALKLNGINESMNASQDTSKTFTISAWIKMNRVDVEQVLISNDSTGVGGYTIKINSSGKVTIDIRSGTSSTTTLSAGTALLVNQWYHIAILRDAKTKSIYINGKAATSVIKVESLGAGGRISIGRGKQTDRFFAGTIDELRIFDQLKSLDWLKTEYNNENDPASFFAIGLEEKNPVPTVTAYLFTGALNNDWSQGANWNFGRVPEPYANVVVKTTAKVIIQNTTDTRLNQLTLEDGASLTLQNSQLLVCKMQVNQKASILVAGSLGIQFNGDVLNNGIISTGETDGTVSFVGNQATTLLSGSGSIRVFHLQIVQGATTSLVNINQPVIVTGNLELKSGILNSIGNVTLAASQTQSASILPISNLANASIIGDVIVEKYVAGSFPSPATARGWRLWSSPVYTTALNGSPEYNLNALKNAVFITGKGGAVNGFDDSPLNGNTVFSHDQSLAGNLSQKYIPIPTFSINVPLGTGLYVYSRGFRNSLDALKSQVLSPPFINPEPYTIRYTGKLFSGDLKVLVNSRNRKEPGDGFNLLGNPYASAISWGSLVKENITAFVWMFNPLNNSYDVSDDPNFRIPTGAGFFVKVADGLSSGAVTFREAAKSSSSSTASSSVSSLKMAAGISSLMPAPKTVDRKLEVLISRGAFSQNYILKLEPGGLDAVSDADALSLAEGYVNIAGLSPDNQKLIVDSRGLVDRQAVVPLYVKGWSSAAYDLNFSGFEGFQPEDSIVLTDKYLNSTLLLSPVNNHYTFNIDANAPQSQGFDRFSLVIRVALQHTPPSIQGGDRQIQIYPNPFQANITMARPVAFPGEMEVVIMDLMGQPVLRRIINTIEESTSVTVDAGSLPKGLYIIELRDKKLNKRLKTAKIIKL